MQQNAQNRSETQGAAMRANMQALKKKKKKKNQHTKRKTQETAISFINRKGCQKFGNMRSETGKIKR